MPLEGSKKKNALFAAVTLVGALFFLETFASWVENFRKSAPTYFSLFNIPYNAGFLITQELSLVFLVNPRKP
jgi:hypothetical protein